MEKGKEGERVWEREVVDEEGTVKGRGRRREGVGGPRERGIMKGR